MRVVLDRAACVGHGRCYALAPNVFQPDEDGYCQPLFDEVPGDLVDEARIGASNCPEDAITLTD